MKKLFYAVLIGLLVCAAGSSWAATTNDVAEGGTEGYPDHLSGQAYVMYGTVDLTATEATAGDVYQVINVPSNTWVLDVGYFCTTLEDSTMTVDIGDGADPDGFFDGSNVETGQSDRAATAFAAGATETIVYLTNEVLSTETVVFLTNEVTTTGTWNGTNVLTSLTLTYGTSTFATAISQTYGTATVVNTAASLGYTDGRLYTSADTLDVTCVSDGDTLVMKVWVLCFPVRCGTSE